ncbi:MAG: hypothetical protein FWC10_06850 [Lentimicrobiaceae bacterium]|nr:hypothetical protein [Lentimicrobiaceae bacterium]
MKKSARLFIMFFVLSGINAMAQKAAPEFSLHADGGIATYCFQPAIKGTSSLGFSSDFGVGFTGFFGRQIGIHTSVGFGLFNVKSKTNLKTVTSNLTQTGASVPLYYDLHTTLTDYTEIHKTMFVTIPVMLQFQTRHRQYWNPRLAQRAGFYALGGVRVNLLFNNKYETHVATLSNAAYYPEYNNWTATQTFAGFGNFDGYNNAGKLDFGVLVMLALETGVKWRIDNNIYVYTGAFFDCGLNNPAKDARKDYKEIIDQEQLRDLPLLKFSDRINLMVVGIKVRIAFSRSLRAY